MQAHIEQSSVEGECSDDSVWPIGKRAAFYSLGVVFFLALMDGIDRQILAALLPYIKETFSLSDTQSGMLISVVNFAIAAFVLPTAFLVDTWSRKKTMALMCSIWSLATAACAFAGTYTHMLMARVMVGAGEAGYNPAAQALLSAQFPKKYRSTALSLAQFGIGLGGPVGLTLGGYLAIEYGWRHAIGVVAIPGFIFAIMALYIKDFKTQKNVKKETKVKGLDSDSYLVRLVSFLKVPSLCCVFIGATLMLMFGGATGGWMPTYFVRYAELPPNEAAGLAALLLLPSMGGFIIAGPVIDFFRRRFQNGVAVAMFLAMCIYTSGKMIAWTLCVPGSFIQMAVLMTTGFTGVICTVGGPTLIMDLVQVRMRASAAGMLVAVQNILGLAIGPLLAGFLSDLYTLNTALIILTVIMGFAALSYFVCMLTFKKDKEKAGCEEAIFE